MKAGTGGQSHFVSGSSFLPKTQLLINKVKVQMCPSCGRPPSISRAPASAETLAAVRAAGTTAKLACRTQLLSIGF